MPTPGTVAAACATSSPKGRCVWLVIRKSAPTTLSMTTVIDDFAEVAKIVRADTRARPIMSADAVAAVRRGWRSAFCTASDPTVPNIRGKANPRTRTIGRARAGLTTIAPTRAARTPSPTSCEPDPPPTAAPAVMAARPATRRIAPAIARKCSERAGSAMSSRRAAIGGMRDARIAGASPATTVTSTPMTSPTMTVRGSSTSPSVGISAPIAENRPCSP